MGPMVPKPHSPDNKDTAHNCRDVKIDRAYIGSCTGGKITDMIFAPNILKGKTVKVKTFVVPGSTEVHADMKRLNLRGAAREGNEKSIEDVLVDAGCLIGASGCRARCGAPAAAPPPPAPPPTPSAASRARKSASPPPTATSPAAWAPRTPPSTSPPPSPSPPAPSPAASPTPASTSAPRSKPAWQESSNATIEDKWKSAQESPGIAIPGS